MSGTLASVICTSSSHGTCNSSMGDLPCSLPSGWLDVDVSGNLGNRMWNMVEPKHGRTMGADFPLGG